MENVLPNKYNASLDNIYTKLDNAKNVMKIV